MRTPYSISRSTLGDTESSSPRAKGSKNKVSSNRQIGDIDESHNKGRTPTGMSASARSTRSIFTNSSIRSSSRSMSTASQIHKSKYENWKVAEVAISDGCQSGCSDGTETVTAFGEVVSEVFDLLNEVAFPEVLDLTAPKPETDKKKTAVNLACGSELYKDDDDSIFNISDEYHKSRKAKDFLGFIGAAKSGTKQFITTPAAPPSLLTPDGMPLSLLSVDIDNSSLVEVEVQVETRKDEEAMKQEIRDDDNNEEDKEIEEFDKETNKIGEGYQESERSRSNRSTSMRSNSSRTRSPDRYSSLDGNQSSEEWSNGEGSEENGDWCSKKNTEENVREEPPSNEPGAVPFALSGAAHIKSAIAQGLGFKRVKPNKFKSPFACISEQPELLTIVESSGEDAHILEEVDDVYEEIQQQHLNQLYQKVEDVIQFELVEAQPNDKADHNDKVEQAVIEKDVINILNNVTNDEEYSSSGISGTSFSCYDDEDDRTYVSYTASDDDSFFDEKDESLTKYSASSTGMEDQSVTYSIKGKDSLLDQSITRDESSYSYELSEDDDDDEREVKIQTSVEKSRMNEEAQKTENTGASLVLPEPFNFCSVYDNLYPTDSIFSFVTQDETEIFDFSNSNIEQDDQQQQRQQLQPPPSILTNESAEAPPSVLTDRSSIDENEQVEVNQVGEEESQGSNEEQTDNEDREESIKNIFEEIDTNVRLEESERIFEDIHAEDCQEELEEIVEQVDTEACQQDIKRSCKDPRNYVTEEREGIEKECNEANDVVEEELQDQKQVLHTPIPILSTIEWETKESSCIPEDPEEPLVIPPPKTNSEERKEDIVVERSHSSHDSCQESTETVEKDKSTGTTDLANQTRKRRQLSRIKMYNKHRQNILKVQRKAE